MSPEIVEAAPEAPDAAGDAAAAKGKKGKSKKKLIIIGAAAAVVLLGGGGAGFMLMSGGGAADTKAEAPKKEAKGHGGGEGHGGEGGGEDAIVDVPAMTVNLRSPDGAARFLRIHFMLVPGENTNAEELKTNLPILLDAYQPFLRELRPEDLAGSAAVFRIKEELMRRAASALGADTVSDVLIQDLVQQ